MHGRGTFHWADGVSLHGMFKNGDYFSK